MRKEGQGRFSEVAEYAIIAGNSEGFRVSCIVHNPRRKPGRKARERDVNLWLSLAHAYAL